MPFGVSRGIFYKALILKHNPLFLTTSVKPIILKGILSHFMAK